MTSRDDVLAQNHRGVIGMWTVEAVRNKTSSPTRGELESVLEQAWCALAVAEAAVDFEHRLPIIDTVLIRPTRSASVEYTLRGSLGRVSSAGLKIRLHGLHMARMKIDGRAEFTELSRHRQSIMDKEGTKVFRKIAYLLEGVNNF
ncbi:hypothetical protein MRX96_058182 [Rhipicephalus microplus]